MSIWKLIKAAFAVRKARRVMFGFLKSKASQNVAGAGLTAVSVLAAIRTLWPTLIPWPATEDAPIAVAATAIGGRLIAFIRGHLRPATIQPMTPTE